MTRAVSKKLTELLVQGLHFYRSVKADAELYGGYTNTGYLVKNHRVAPLKLHCNMASRLDRFLMLCYLQMYHHSLK